MSYRSFFKGSLAFLLIGVAVAVAEPGSHDNGAPVATNTNAKHRTVELAPGDSRTPFRETADNKEDCVRALLAKIFQASKFSDLKLDGLQKCSETVKNPPFRRPRGFIWSDTAYCFKANDKPGNPFQGRVSVKFASFRKGYSPRTGHYDRIAFSCGLIPVVHTHRSFFKSLFGDSSIPRSFVLYNQTGDLIDSQEIKVTVD